MPLPNLSEIKPQRIALHLTQSQLAAQAKVSQSLIAKIEQQSIMPSYDKCKRIFDALQAEQQQHTVVAKDLMHRKVVTLPKETPLRKAIALMQKNAVSQLPVVSGEKVVGTLAEHDILLQMQSAKNLEQFARTPVSSVMQESLPIIAENLPHAVIAGLLEYHPAVLVGVRGKLSGIITKADLLTMVGSPLTKPRKV